MALSMIKGDIKKQIDDVLSISNDYTHDSMFADSGTKNTTIFCEIKKISEPNQMSLIVDANLSGYKGTETMEDIEVSIVLENPCCLSHALEEITEEFIQLFYEEYGELPYCRQYFLEGLSVKGITDNLISMELELGT